MENVGKKEDIQHAKDWAIRNYLPYGIYICDDCEVLFDRGYSPMYRRKNGVVTAVNPNEWIKYTSQIWFYDDSTSPVRNKKTIERCIAVMREWGVFLPDPRRNRVV